MTTKNITLITKNNKTYMYYTMEDTYSSKLVNTLIAVRDDIFKYVDCTDDVFTNRKTIDAFKKLKYTYTYNILTKKDFNEEYIDNMRI